MRTREAAQTVTGSSPAASTTSVVGTIKSGFFLNADKLVIDASITGVAGGSVDVYLQRKIATNTWADLAHLPQLASGAGTFNYTAVVTGDGSSLVAVGRGTDASPTPTLAANTIVNVIPGGDIRVVAVAGAGAAAGSNNISVTLTPYTERK